MFSRFIDYSRLAPIVLIFCYILFGIWAELNYDCDAFPSEKRLVDTISIGLIRLDNNVWLFIPCTFPLLIGGDNLGYECSKEPLILLRAGLCRCEAYKAVSYLVI